MSLSIVSGFNGVTDPDAGAYIAAVEAADGQLLEFGVGKAINDFVVGCKADSLWSAIKASCILAGARTLSGALVPLAGTAPTNNNFVSGDYDRKTGLIGDGSTKYLNSNRANNADPQDSRHLAVYASTRHSGNYLYISTATTLNGNGDSYIYQNFNGTVNTVKLSSSGSPSGGISGTNFTSGFYGSSRSTPGSILVRRSSASVSVSQTSSAPVNEALNIYGTTGFYSNARLAFYSIGESLDLALLDARVSALITAFGVAIP